MAESNQPETVCYSFGIIEVQKRDSSAPTGGNPFYTTAIETKMTIPPLLTGIEEETILGGLLS